MLKYILLSFIFILTPSANAQVIYQQMSADYQKLGAIMESFDLENKDTDKLGYLVTKSEFRVTAFRLQGVLRILKSSQDFSSSQESKIKSLFTEVKEIEDIIGKMAEASDILTSAKENGASKKKLDELKDKADKKSKELKDVFKDAGWLDKNKPEDAISSIKFLKNYTGSEEISLVSQSIKSELLGIKEKISTELVPNMSQSVFSYESMEHNFHEFRRSIRWIAIYFQSLHGIFSLTEYSLEGRTESEIQILQKYKGNKYAEIESSSAPVSLDRYNFYLLAHYISEAGLAKDVSEKHFKLLQNDLKSDLDEDQFKRDMVKMMEDFLSSDLVDNLLISLM